MLQLCPVLERYVANFLDIMQNLFITIDEHSKQLKLLSGIESVDGEWHAHLHLTGFFLLARARLGLEEKLKEKHVAKAIRCFFKYFL